MLNFADRTLLSWAIIFICGPVFIVIQKTVGVGLGPLAVHCPSLLYTNDNNLNMNDNKLLLVTSAVDPRYRLSAFPSDLKNNIKD